MLLRHLTIPHKFHSLGDQETREAYGQASSTRWKLQEQHTRYTQTPTNNFNPAIRLNTILTCPKMRHHKGTHTWAGALPPEGDLANCQWSQPSLNHAYHLGGGKTALPPNAMSKSLSDTDTPTAVAQLIVACTPVTQENHNTHDGRRADRVLGTWHDKRSHPWAHCPTNSTTCTALDTS